jgi:protein-S-isoprenylcysteine O-methyltransferase Ste14
MLWARVTIGRNWSGGVVLKEDHELVTYRSYRKRVKDLIPYVV